jgi:Protein of unknown function (DUF1045)
MTVPHGFGPEARVALYYAPAETDSLWERAVSWLGRDPASDAAVAQPELPGLPEITAEAAAYGFHATLRPPMGLRDGATWADLVAATRALAAGVPKFALPALTVTDLFGFLALTEAEPSTALQAYADACIAGVEHLRAPPGEAELARRRRAGLARAEDANLVRWGYPYVFATWFFHMTLTRKLTEREQATLRPAVEDWFGPVLEQERQVTDICLFVQLAPGQPFTIAERISLG